MADDIDALMIGLQSFATDHSQDVAPQLGGGAIESKVRATAALMGVDPHIAAAVADQESAFNPTATSPTNVKGPLQVTSKTAETLGFDPKDVRSNPDLNMIAGLAYIQQQAAKNGGDLNKALSAYPDPKDLSKWLPSVQAKADTSRQGAELDQLLNGVQDFTGKPGNEITVAYGPSGNTAGFVSAPNPGEPYSAIQGGALSQRVGQLVDESKAIQANQSPSAVALRSLFPPALLMQQPVEQTMAMAGAGSGLPPSSSLQQEGSPMLAQQEASRQAGAEQYPTTVKVGEAAKSFIPGTPENLVGRLIAPLLQMPLQAGGKLIGNLFAKTKLTSDVGETIAGKMIPALTRTGVAKQAEKGIEIGVKMKNAALAANPDVKIALNDLANDKQLWDKILALKTPEEQAAAKKMLNQFAYVSGQKNLSGAETDQLREQLWKLGKYNKISGTPSDAEAASFNRMLAYRVKEKMVSIFGKDYEQALNQQSLFLPVKAAMERTAGKVPGLVSAAGRGGAAYFTHGLSELPNWAPSATLLSQLLYRGAPYAALAGRSAAAMSLPTD
jgi:transglycosylase-like protein with SLT domain